MSAVMAATGLSRTTLVSADAGEFPTSGWLGVTHPVRWDGLEATSKYGSIADLLRNRFGMSYWRPLHFLWGIAPPPGQSARSHLGSKNTGRSSVLSTVCHCQTLRSIPTSQRTHSMPPTCWHPPDWKERRDSTAQDLGFARMRRTRSATLGDGFPRCSISINVRSVRLGSDLGKPDPIRAQTINVTC